MNTLAGRAIGNTVAVMSLLLTLSGCDQASHPREQTRPVTVDEVIEHPERFTRDVIVIGQVSQVDPAKSAFALGCEDACVVLPVKFAGNLPAVGRDVVVRGHVKQGEQGRYVFDARAVESK